jgi:hypothetical protein
MVNVDEHRRRRPASVVRAPAAVSRVALVAIIVLGASGCIGPFGDDGDSSRSGGVPFGAFLGSDAAGVAALAGFEAWLAGPRVTVGHTYLPGDTWSSIEGPDGILDPWAQWRREGRGRLLVLNVPMLERNEEGVPDEEVAALLRRGADGEFDEHLARLARRLVERGIGDTVIVLGWEMNGTTYTGRCSPNPEAWIGYWRRIVAAMRGEPGQAFRFDFAPVRGEHAVPWTSCYPGDDVVDIIGMDSYDQPPGAGFEEYVEQPYGLRDQVEFAAARRKPVSYPEWGLYDHGDNPAYIEAMLDWIDDHQAVYQTITDYCPHGVWPGNCNPSSARTYRDRMRAR